MECPFQTVYGSEKVWAVEPPTDYIILDKLLNVSKPRPPYSATKMVMLVLIFKLVSRLDIMYVNHRAWHSIHDG